jgi:hypothetical protein
LIYNSSWIGGDYREGHTRFLEYIIIYEQLVLWRPGQYFRSVIQKGDFPGTKVHNFRQAMTTRWNSPIYVQRSTGQSSYYATDKGNFVTEKVQQHYQHDNKNGVFIFKLTAAFR